MLAEAMMLRIVSLDRLINSLGMSKIKESIGVYSHCIGNTLNGNETVPFI